MKKREAISRVKGAIKEINADSRLTNKRVWSMIDTKTVYLINQESDKLKIDRIQKLYQTLPCIRMEEAPAGDSCCDVKTYCTVFRSVEPIPEIYSDSYGAIIDSVTTIDGSIQIKMTTPKDVQRAKKDSNSRFDKTVYGFYKENYLYIANEKYPLVSMEAMFKDDLSLRKAHKCGEEVENCIKYLDTDWVVPQKLEDTILNTVVLELANVYKRIPEDQNINKNTNN
jgi:hypothetical protein